MTQAMKLTAKTLALIFASAGVIGYAQAQTGTATTTTASAPAAVPGLTDGQIVEIVKNANEAEVDLAKVGKSKAENKEVKDFAKMMEDAHKKGEKDTKEAAKKAKVKAIETADSRMVKDTTKSKISDLKKLKGKDFDRAYMDAQVAMHQTLLDDLTNKYIPSAQSPDVKAHLEATKVHVEEHLAKAKQLQTTMMQ